jgi:hypothetical protein
MLAANSPPPASSASALVAKPVEIPPVSGSDDADALAVADAVADAVGLALAVAVALGLAEAVGLAAASALGSDTGTHSPLGRRMCMCGQPSIVMSSEGTVLRPSHRHKQHRS